MLCDAVHVKYHDAENTYTTKKPITNKIDHAQPIFHIPKSVATIASRQISGISLSLYRFVDFKYMPLKMYVITLFLWRKHDNISPCTGSRVITSFERIASCAGTQFRSRASESQGNSAACYYAKCPNQSATTRTSKKLLAVWYHTPGTTTSRLWAGTILHWAAYTWHLRKDIIVLYGGNIRTCLRALAAGKLPAINELLHVLKPSIDPGPHRLKGTPPPAIIPSVQTTQHVRQNIIIQSAIRQTIS